MRQVISVGALAACVVAIGAVVAVADASGATPGAAPASGGALPGNWYGAAPYLMPLDNNPPDLGAVMSATGQKTFELAFVLSGGGCDAAWGGNAPVSADTAVGNLISSVRAAGGDVSASFGGYGGTKLGEVCGSAAATASAEQAVLAKYGLKAIDLDLEEPEYENTTAIDNEIGAAKILQQNNPGLYISITTAGTSAGTGYFGQNVLNTAKNAGFTPQNYAIMPFDGGFSGGAASQISALEAFHGLLMNTFGWDGATAYAHEGFSGMNGRSDSGEYFTQSDFQSVLDYATGHGLSRFTFWSVNRDRQCNPPDNNGQTSGTCSSVPQNSWDFTRYTAKFAGATPPPPTSTTPPPPTTSSTPAPPPTTTTSPGGGTGQCAGVAAWNSTTAYTGGQEATYNSHLWTAKWWTYNDIPGGPAGVWTDDGPC